MSEPAELAALRARLEALEAAEAIRRLKARYAELVDSRYEGGGPRPPEALARIAGEIAELFTDDAVWDGGGGLGVQRGHEAIRARMAEPTLLFSRHYFVNPAIEVTGDRARARAGSCWRPARCATVARPGWPAPRTTSTSGSRAPGSTRR